MAWGRQDSLILAAHVAEIFELLQELERTPTYGSKSKQRATKDIRELVLRQAGRLRYSVKNLDD
jgi:hypothetical protein